MSAVATVFKALEKDPSHFERFLNDLPQGSINHLPHALHSSRTWSNALLDEEMTLWSHLRRGPDAHNNCAWTNLEALLQQLNLSPMPLLLALYSLSDRMNVAMQCAAKNVRDPKDIAKLGTRTGPSLRSLVSPLGHTAWLGAELVDKVGLRDVLQVIRWVVERLLSQQKCDPLALTPSLREKLSVTGVAAMERAVDPTLLSACTHPEVSAVLNMVHWLRCLQLCTQIATREGFQIDALQSWSRELYEPLRTAHLQLCTVECSPPVQIQLPEARRKALKRYGESPSRGQLEQLGALLAKQQEKARDSGTRWVQEELTRRNQEWHELVARCALTCRTRSSNGVVIEANWEEGDRRYKLAQQASTRLSVYAPRNRSDPIIPKPRCNPTDRKREWISVERYDLWWPLESLSDSSSSDKELEADVMMSDVNQIDRSKPVVVLRARDIMRLVKVAATDQMAPIGMFAADSHVEIMNRTPVLQDACDRYVKALKRFLGQAFTRPFIMPDKSADLMRCEFALGPAETNAEDTVIPLSYFETELRKVMEAEGSSSSLLAAAAASAAAEPQTTETRAFQKGLDKCLVTFRPKLLETMTGVATRRWPKK